MIFEWENSWEAEVGLFPGGFFDEADGGHPAVIDRLTACLVGLGDDAFGDFMVVMQMIGDDCVKTGADIAIDLGQFDIEQTVRINRGFVTGGGGFDDGGDGGCGRHGFGGWIGRIGEDGVGGFHWRLRIDDC